MSDRLPSSKFLHVASKYEELIPVQTHLTNSFRDSCVRVFVCLQVHLSAIINKNFADPSLYPWPPIAWSCSRQLCILYTIPSTALEDSWAVLCAAATSFSWKYETAAAPVSQNIFLLCYCHFRTTTTTYYISLLFETLSNLFRNA